MSSRRRRRRSLRYRSSKVPSRGLPWVFIAVLTVLVVVTLVARSIW